MEGRYNEYAGIIWNIYFQAWNNNRELLEKVAFMKQQQL